MPSTVLYNRIKELCAKRGTTIAQLEKELGFSNATIRKWGNNTSPSVDKIEKVAEYFGVSLDYILGKTNIEETVDVVVGDSDIISFQRAKQNMSVEDSQRMMQMLRLAFYNAFLEEGDNDC